MCTGKTRNKQEYCKRKEFAASYKRAVKGAVPQQTEDNKEMRFNDELKAVSKEKNDAYPKRIQKRHNKARLAEHSVRRNDKMSSAKAYQDNWNNVVNETDYDLYSIKVNIRL